MKKFMTLFLTFCLLFSFSTGCSKTKNATALAKSIYNDLISANEECKTIEKAVYGAWYFAEYEANNYHYENILVYYTESTGIAGNHLIEAAKSHGIGVPEILFTLSNINITVPCTITALKINNTIPTLDKNLKSSKDNLEKMEKRFSTYEYFTSLKSLHIKINAYSQKLISPENGMKLGGLREIIDTYENEINELISSLDFLVDLE